MSTTTLCIIIVFLLVMGILFINQSKLKIRKKDHFAVVNLLLWMFITISTIILFLNNYFFIKIISASFLALCLILFFLMEIIIFKERNRNNRGF